MRRVVSRFNRTGGWSDTVPTMDTKKLSLMQILDKKFKGFGKVDLKDKTARRLLLREIELTIREYQAKKREEKQ